MVDDGLEGPADRRVIFVEDGDGGGCYGFGWKGAETRKDCCVVGEIGAAG